MTGYFTVICCVCYPLIANAALIMTAIMIILILPLVWLLAVKNQVCELKICMYCFPFEWLWHQCLQEHNNAHVRLYIMFLVLGRVMGGTSQLGAEGRRTWVEEIGFIPQLISPDNREHHVSARNGIYRSHESPLTGSNPYKPSAVIRSDLFLNSWISHFLLLFRLLLDWTQHRESFPMLNNVHF